MVDVRYWAILERNRAGEVFAIPDMPGVTAGSATATEALRWVAEFAADNVRDLVGAGHPVPPARHVDEIPHDPEATEYGRGAIQVELPG
jgi:hypothetical protein